MINGNIQDFLDTGWYNEATLFYDGYIYWCEGYTDASTHLSTFFVDRWAAQTQDYMHYSEIRLPDGSLKDYRRVFETSENSMDKIKRAFLQAPLFNGESFWQIEKDIAWLDEGAPTQLSDESLTDVTLE